jgi:hypothetical protein
LSYRESHNTEESHNNCVDGGGKKKGVHSLNVARIKSIHRLGGRGQAEDYQEHKRTFEVTEMS